MSPKYYKVIINNRKAFHDFNFEETYKSGIALLGSEVKSVRLGRANFKDAFCRVDNGELWLYNMHISPYGKGQKNLDPDRNRKLLLTKRELKKIIGRVAERGMVAIPTRLFLDGNWVKVEIGVGKAKKKFEKKETLKLKAVKRDIERELREKQK